MSFEIVVGIVIFLFGLFVGYMIGKPKPDGVFRINTSDPEKDIYSLEVTDPIDDIEKKKRLTFVVKKDA